MTALTTHERVVNQAKLAALAHQEEFPGQPLCGDWDSESWQISAADLGLNGEEKEEYWPLYLDTLRETVTSIIDGAIAAE